MGIFQKIKKKLFSSEIEKTVTRWYQADGENTLRIDYDNLNENSIVIDLGDIKANGQVTSTQNIFVMFLYSNLHLFSIKN